MKTKTLFLIFGIVVLLILIFVPNLIENIGDIYDKKFCESVNKNLEFDDTKVFSLFDCKIYLDDVDIVYHIKRDNFKRCLNNPSIESSEDETTILKIHNILKEGGFLCLE